MEFGFVIKSNDAETVRWAFRYANYLTDKGDSVEIFLLGKGVEAEEIDTEQFKVTEEIEEFYEKDNGEIFACGKCMEIRKKDSTETCPVSTMDDLDKVVKTNEKVLTF